MTLFEKLAELNNKSRLIEKELLSRLMFDAKQAIVASKVVSSSDFYHFSKEFSLCVDIAKNDKNPAIELSSHDILVSQFLEDVSFRNIEIIAKELKELSTARQVYVILENSLQNVPMENLDSFISGIQRKLLSGVSKLEVEKSYIQNVIDEYKIQQQIYTEKFKNGGGIIGLSTGYTKLDEIIDGLRKEHLWIIGGYANLGKTFAALNIVADLIKQGKRVVFYSIEMSRIDILSRLLGIMTNQSGLTILKKYPHNETSVELAFKTLIESKLSIYSSKSELSEIEFSMYEENLKQPVDLFVVDFIQLITVKGAKSEYETITTSALELQQMAKRLKTTVMALSQISNDGARNSNDFVMSFKGSGAIAAAADLAIEIQSGEGHIDILREKMKNGTPVQMKWIIRKNRHGRVGTLEMSFDGRTGISIEKPFELDMTS
jgi:replicative DNA helicase